MAATEAYALDELRTWPTRTPNEDNYTCPVCTCRKTGFVSEPNGRDECCQDEQCRCHDDVRRCDCCDGHDGLGIYHFADVDALAAFLARPHETVCEIDVETVPDEPYGMAFVTAGEAEAWLAEFLEADAAERAYEHAMTLGARR